MKNKILIIMFAMIFLTSFASADLFGNEVEFDNVIGDYDPVNQIVTITNTFGIGGDIATMQLLTPLDNKVPMGINISVAEIQINSSTNYNNALKDMEFFDIHNSMGELDKKFYYKYKTIEAVVVDDYSEICTPMLNLTLVCNGVKSGSHIEQREVWLDFPGTTLTNGQTVTIGIYTDVELGDKIEWIPTYMGVEIDEWAVWTQSLEKNLRSYYALNGTAGGVADAMGNYSGINIGAERNQPGKVNNAFYFDRANDERVNVSRVITDYGEISVNMWFRTNSTVNKQIFSNQKAGKNDDLQIAITGVNGKVHVQRSDDDTATDYLVEGDANVSDGNWHMVTAVLNSSGMLLFVDGVVQTDNDAFNEATTNQGGFGIGADDRNFAAAPFNGTIDEVGIWDRSLTGAEVIFLYNGGLGISPVQSTALNFTVTLTSPANATQSIRSTNYFVTNNTGLINGNFSNSTLYVWNLASGLLGTNFTTITGTNFTSTNLSISGFPAAGNLRWNQYTCADNSTGNSYCQWGINRTFDMIPFEVDSETFNNNSYETDTETFDLTITTLPTVTSLSASLIYNGTSYVGTSSCSAGSCDITATIDIPLTNQNVWSENKSFHWLITTFDGTSTVTTSTTTPAQTQNVTRVIFGHCQEDFTTPIAINYTVFAETNNTIPLAVDFDATFDYYLGTGTVFKTNSSSSATQVHNETYCIDTNETFKIKPVIEISRGNYQTRIYEWLEIPVTNVTTLQKLFLLNTTESTKVIVEVKDQGLVDLSGVLVNISRFYPGTGKYIPVKAAVTDDFGQMSVQLIEDTVKYRFEFYGNAGNLLKTSPDITVSCRSSLTVCILPFIIEDIGDEFEDFGGIDGFSDSLTFNNVTNQFIYSWDDQSGDLATINFVVERIRLNATETICDLSTNSSLFTLNCSVGDSINSYKATVHRQVFGERNVRINVLNIKVNDPVDNYGVEGLFWAFILLMTMIGIGAFNPTVGAALYGIGFLMLGLLGIISMPGGVFFANTFICIAFIWAVNT